MIQKLTAIDSDEWGEILRLYQTDVSIKAAKLTCELLNSECTALC